MSKNISLLPISDGMLRFFAWKAVNKDDGSDNLFTSAEFSKVLQEEIGFSEPVDGLLIRMILVGRNWVSIDENNNCYWRMK